ncbi:MAG: AI-2E family transporter [Phycisphaerales bacterium]
MTSSNQSGASVLITLATILAGVATLYLGRDLLMPLAIAGLIAFCLAPMVRRLEKRRVPRIAAVVIVSLGALVPLAGVGWVVVAQGSSVVADLPTYKESLQKKLNGLRRALADLGQAADTVNELERSISAPLPTPLPDAPAAADPPDALAVQPASPAPAPSPAALPPNNPTAPTGALTALAGGAAAVLAPLAMIGVVLIIVPFILLEREDLRDRFVALLNRRRPIVTSTALDEIADRVSGYLRAQLLINTCSGIAMALALMALGVPNALLWGLLAIGLRFIPYVGPIVASVLPVATALVVADGWLLPALVLGALLTIESLTNLSEPFVQKSSTGVSSLALLLAAAFWSWVWGVPGLLVSTPLTVCLVVAGQHARPLRWLRILLSETPPLTPAERLYQRLIAAEPTDAARLATEFGTGMPLADLGDTLLGPALVAARTDAERDDLDPDRARAMAYTVCAVCEELALRLPVLATTTPPTPGRGVVLCIPAGDEIDEAACVVLATLLASAGLPARAISPSEFDTDLVPVLAAHTPRTLCVVAVGAATTNWARRRVRQCTLRVPEAAVWALLLGADAEQPTDTEAVRRAGAQRAFTTFRAAVADLLANAAPGHPQPAAPPGDPVPAPMTRRMAHGEHVSP